MKLAVALAGCLLVLAGCATPPKVGPLDVDPNIPFLPAGATWTTPTSAATPSPTASPSESASPSPSPSATASADSECTKNDSDECIKAGDACTEDTKDESGKDADDKNLKCTKDGDTFAWKAA
jgi:hypothetical protein